ncbi:MAG: tRNA (guanosine(37)-N1)-methyltransferase TrmD [Candidatus Peribacteraceae bacterium]|nr:tRNA (guanosine(37)-N1)-methyltransferase TrmD [Candidatus Peribacteraceae bacterium]
MRIDILTLFPDMFTGPLTESILKRAVEDKLLAIHTHDIRAYATDKHRQADDKPYGGGAGMVMKVDVIVAAIEGVVAQGREEMKNGKWKVKSDDVIPHRVYLSAAGERLTQAKVDATAEHEWLILLCGRYEGVDQRVIDDWIDEQISIGDYVLTGGEIPAMVLIDAVARKIPGVLGKEASGDFDSFSEAFGGKREYPQYTRPEEFRGKRVPDVLLSGHHEKIEQWRREKLF